jgi:hypothetical protein
MSTNKKQKTSGGVGANVATCSKVGQPPVSFPPSRLSLNSSSLPSGLCLSPLCLRLTPRRPRLARPQLLKTLMRNPAAGAFLAPVDWKALQLPTYPKIVKHPMDLGTIQQKLDSSRYAKVEDFIADVRLVWSNAKAFNLEGSDIYEVAMLLEEEFEGKLELQSGPLREGGASSSKGGGGGGGGGGSSGGALSGEQLAQCKAAMRELRKHKDAGAFLEPVDWKALGIRDYPTIIKRPMDLGTVQKRLDSGQYNSVLDVAADIDLVWSNAMTYNQDESYIYNVAADLKSFSDRKMAPLVAAAREAGDVPHELTFEMKRQLNENAALLSSKDLYGMVGIVEEHCRRALDNSNPQEVEIDIDSLDLTCFLKVDKYVQDCIARAKKKKAA